MDEGERTERKGSTTYFHIHTQWGTCAMIGTNDMARGEPSGRVRPT